MCIPFPTNGFLLETTFFLRKTFVVRLGPISIWTASCLGRTCYDWSEIKKQPKTRVKADWNDSVRHLQKSSWFVLLYRTAPVIFYLSPLRRNPAARACVGGADQSNRGAFSLQTEVAVSIRCWLGIEGLVSSEISGKYWNVIVPTAVSHSTTIILVHI